MFKRKITTWLTLVMMLANIIGPRSAYALTNTLGTDFVADEVIVAAGDMLVTNGYDMDISGTIQLDGTLDASSGAGGDSFIYVAGDWTMGEGSFRMGASSVIFDGVDQSISGNTTFYNFTKTESSDDSTDSNLTFEADSIQLISNTLTIDGLDDDDMVNILSDSGGTRFNLKVDSAQSVSYVGVTDSEVQGSADITASNSANTSNNDDGEGSPEWVFIGGANSFGGAGDGYDSIIVGNVDIISFASTLDQTFTSLDGATAMGPITIKQEFGLAASGINVADDLRITIPEELEMLWDEDDTIASITGIAADGTVSPNVTFVTGARTVVFDVTTAFINEASITISGLNFETFTAAGYDRLEVEIDNAGTKIKEDIFIKTINLVSATATATGGSDDGYDAFVMNSGFDTYVWNGLGDSVWADENNWVPGVGYPDDANDIVVINSTSDNITTAGTITVGEVSITSGFGGTLTLGAPLTIGNSGNYTGSLIVDDGTIDTAGYDLSVDGTLNSSRNNNCRRIINKRRC